ncbi:MAG: type I-MYXAN CRISPR-associated Cas8a1/Cmx1 [Nostoc sp.]|uniref:type I-MYXAN CRISPR-associated Cas8a1/Cmx1 n=1 Tax=Nostoc sp. TaxID=1180 RepID=UPI002FF768CC
MSIVASIVNPKIQLNLGDPSITWIHRAGIAGLWMTLKQLEKLYPIPAERPGNLTWLLTPRSISLEWQGQDFLVLDWLLKQSFQINEEGLISLTGLNTHSINIETQINIHLGITGTFLQHNQIFKFDGGKSWSLIVDGVELDVKYKKAVSYAHQHFAKQLCDKQGQLFEQSISVAGWLYPGSVVRHVAFTKETKFEEKPELAFALLYAPVACHYFVLRSHTKLENTQYVLVIPEVVDLEIYAQEYWNLRNLDYKNFHISSLGDAALKFLTYEKIIELATPDPVKRCQVMLFGTVIWSKQQKTRIEIAVVEATEIIDFIYKLSRIYFPEYQIIKYKNKNLIISNMFRGTIADNLVKGFPWWANLYTIFKNKSLLKLITNDGVYKMIQNSEWNLESQKLFIKACHEALKKIYAKIYGRTNEGQYAQIERENIRILSQLRRCTNAENFRKFIAEFWGRAGQLSILEKHWEELLPLTSGIMDWKVARDLTFIALASYPKSNMVEKKILDISDSNRE